MPLWLLPPPFIPLTPHCPLGWMDPVHFFVSNEIHPFSVFSLAPEAEPLTDLHILWVSPHLPDAFPVSCADSPWGNPVRFYFCLLGHIIFSRALFGSTQLALWLCLGLWLALLEWVSLSFELALLFFLPLICWLSLMCGLSLIVRLSLILELSFLFWLPLHFRLFFLIWLSFIFRLYFIFWLSLTFQLFFIFIAVFPCWDVPSFSCPGGWGWKRQRGDKGDWGLGWKAGLDSTGISPASVVPWPGPA